MVQLQRPVLNLLRLKGFPIFAQLKLEEALLRADHRNWSIINCGTAPTSIVMGISGRPHQLLNVPAVLRDRVPVIKRFSGGGTVIVDEDTVFVTLMAAEEAVPGLPLFPKPIMKWTEGLYAPVFAAAPGFALREHDYVFKDHKFGGNAQSIVKGRWLHHTSFLWDYKPLNMGYLALPDRAPDYRQARSHEEFLCKLSGVFPTKEHLEDGVVGALERHFTVQEVGMHDVENVLDRHHVNSTRLLTKDELNLSMQPS